MRLPRLSSSLFLTLFALISLLPIGCRADEPLPTGPHQMRIVWKGDAHRGATISWSTLSEGTTHRLHYRPAGSDQWQTLDCQRSGRHPGKLEGGKRLYYHHARLTDLSPSTRYDFQCESDGEKTRELYFVTAPEKDLPRAIIFGGDSRSGIEARRDVNRMIARLVEEQSAASRPPILALAHGGDYIADGRKLPQWYEWLTDQELTIGRDGRVLPIIPARGNHDVGPLFDEIFDFPPGDGNYYTTDLGPQVRLTTLNTEVSTSGDQRSWLEAELKANRRKFRWYVVQYHTPAFPAVKAPSTAYANWVPLFDQYRPDLVCEADGHNIKRTSPILDNKIHPDGIVYIGEGGLGVGQRTPKTDRWYLAEMAEKNSLGHHVHLLTFDADYLDVRVIRLGGETFDNFKLFPRKWDE